MSPANRLAASLSLVVAHPPARELELRERVVMSGREKALVSLILFGLIVSAVILLVSCGGGGSSSSFPSSNAGVTVSASPANVTLTSGTTRQFTATVTHSSNTAVAWTATAGTVSSSGLFTAPTVSSTTQVNVTATSKADSSKSSTVALTVSALAVKPAAAALAVKPTTMSFAGRAGAANPSPAGMSITNSGSGTLTFSGVSDQPWLALSAASGTAPSTIEVSPLISGLKVGNYTGHVTVTAGGVTKAVTVALSITAAPVQHSVALAWKATTDPKIVSYSMYRSTISGSAYGLLASALSQATYSDQSVISGTIYYYVVTAVNDTGQESTYSNETRVTVP